MNKKQGVVALVVLAAVVGAAAFYVYQGTAPTTPEEFTEVDTLFSELDEFLSFEDQDIGDISLDDLGSDW